MSEIPDALRLFYETKIGECDGQNVVSIPTGLVGESTLAPEDVYRVALINSSAIMGIKTKQRKSPRKTYREQPKPIMLNQRQSKRVKFGR